MYVSLYVYVGRIVCDLAFLHVVGVCTFFCVHKGWKSYHVVVSSTEDIEDFRLRIERHIDRFDAISAH